ncbi:dUTP diphosphatase [Bacillus sp. REN10]|uniref:dUTP diphosphatase n=1 Tax=Bacillus sp. REN10 TaxID=2782541 RepID=UPI00193C6192|nr:dUTP diphosphatase [Bacillus sp. REN10]
MNFVEELKNLQVMQHELDEKIIETKGLEGQDLFLNMLLALYTEVGEMANEWRGFKHWSDDQEPRYKVECHCCRGKGGFTGVFSSIPDEKEMCTYCNGSGIQERPLLEEYADCFSFLLHIGNELDFQPIFLFENDIDAGKPITVRFLELHGGISVLYHNWKHDEPCLEIYEFTLNRFLFLGEALGFSREQIVAAYKEKNAINHARQESGY